MTPIFATTNARIWGTAESWGISSIDGDDQPVHECPVELEIQGDDRNGYNLLMSPAGYFAADSWHETKDAALLSALELFGVSGNDWSSTRPGTGE